MVYRCPMVHCHCFYATKLALRRHLIPCTHFITADFVEFDPHLHVEEAKRNTVYYMSRVFKCLVLDCAVLFTDVAGLYGHFSEVLSSISEPTISKR